MNELTQQGINALRSGDRETARSLLAAAIKQDPNDAAAWLWLAGALSKDEERMQCLQQVLRIDPGNAVAARGLAQILERRTRPQPAAAPASQPEQAGQPAPAAEAAPATSDASATPVAPTPVAPTPVAPTPIAPPPVAPATTVVPATTVAQTPVEPIPVEPTPVTEAAEPAAERAGAETAAAQPAAAEAAPQQAVLPQPVDGRRKRSRAYVEGEQVVFKTRPSVVLALIGFWVFLIGAIAIGVLLQGAPVLSLSLAVGMGFILEMIVLYAAIRNLTARYEVTNYQVSLRFRGKRARVQVADILAAECRQSLLQKMLGTGDLLLDGSVRGELVHLRMRNIPECQRRLAQLQALLPSSETGSR